MKIQFLNGGLANQAFQYIFARYYELSHPGEIMYMDDSYFALNTVHNGYELEKVFGIRPHMLSDCFDEDVWAFILEERRAGKSIPQILCENGIEMSMIAETEYEKFNPFSGHVSYVPCNEYHPEILDEPGEIYYHGYWINKEWFSRYKDQFLEEFCFPELTDSKNQTYLKQILDTNSVSIHIRRGDFVTIGWAYHPDKYRDIVRFFTANVPGKWDLFVFSDDIPWCREHQAEMEFQRFSHVTFIEGNTHGQNYIDLLLMSRCKSMLVSNSSFCYLAALLNTNLQYSLNSTDREL